MGTAATRGARMPLDRGGRRDRLVDAGRRAWALLGLLLVAWVVALGVARVSLVVIALVLALFPAAVLAPASSWLVRRGVPPSLAALGVLVLLVAALAGIVRLLVPPIVDQVPDFADALSRAVERVEQALAGTALSFDVDGVSSALERGLEALGGREGLASDGITIATTLVDIGTGVALAVVALFFYLKDGRRLWRGLTDLVPGRYREQVEEVAERVWWTLGAYFRGQLLVALFDAVFIGLGLLLLGVPLALPLAVVVFFGGLFPIVGALVSGLLAVLVAFADDGLVQAALVLGLVILVQQAEGYLFEPFVLSKAIALHPLVVIVAIAAGTITLGILGAFVAVPVAAGVARAVDYLRDRTPDAGPGSDGEQSSGRLPPETAHRQEER